MSLGDNFWYIHTSKFKFSTYFYTGNTTGKKILSSRRVIQNPEVLSQYFEKMKILWL